MIEWFEKVEKICQDICSSEGCYLYDLVFSGIGQGRTLQVFIDKDNGGAGVEDCSNVSKGLNEALDADDLIPGGPYHLEVSTPGIDRILRKAWHFEKVVGKKIWVKTEVAFEELGVLEPTLKKAKQVEAVLKEFKNDTLILENKKASAGSLEVNLPFAKIEKAKVVFEMPKKLKP
jgi:ribosome maturation factor RimP